jgi:hypothetical protein
MTGDPNLADAPPEVVQAALVDAIKAYGRCFEEGVRFPAFTAEHGVTQTDAAYAASQILKAAEIELFELAMWEIWT